MDLYETKGRMEKPYNGVRPYINIYYPQHRKFRTATKNIEEHNFF